MKCRSDEVYDLKSFTDCYATSPGRPLFLNYIVRESAYCDFHLSDHVFASSLDVMRTSISNLLHALDGTNRDGDWLRLLDTEPAPEVALTLSFLVSLGEPLSRLLGATSREAFNILRHHFRLFDIAAVSGYQLSANHAGFYEIRDFPRLAKAWNPHNTLRLRHFRSIDALGPEPRVKVRLRNLTYLVAHKVGRALATNSPEMSSQ